MTQPISPPSQPLFEQAVRVLSNSRNTCLFSGAGMSAESGIPTFRDAGGVWDRFDPESIGTPMGLMRTFMRQPEVIHEFLKEAVATFEKAQPNAGHRAAAEMESAGYLRSVITQNIDDLHRIAGSQKVIEVHGNLYRARCLSCGHRIQEDRETALGRLRPVLDQAQPPSLDALADALAVCDKCGGKTRPDVVLFGEGVLQMPESYIEAANCDVMIVVGTSGLVHPAANIPIESKNHGATLIEINPGPSAFEETVDIHLNAPAGEMMDRLWKAAQS